MTESKSWYGTQKSGDWLISLNADELTITLQASGHISKFDIEEFLTDTSAIEYNPHREEITEAAAKILEHGLKLRNPPPGGWVNICDCNVCRDWDNVCCQDNSSSSDNPAAQFPNGVERLVFITGNRRISPPEIRLCPECGTYYKFENERMWTTDGGEDDDYMYRLDPLEVLSNLPEREKKELISRWDKLKESLSKCTNSKRGEIANYANKAFSKMNVSVNEILFNVHSPNINRNQKNKPKLTQQKKWVSICNCSICGDWPNNCQDEFNIVDASDSLRFPEGVKKLVFISGDRKSNPPEILRCPDCGTYYKIENYYEMGSFGAHDEDYMTRLIPSELQPLLPERENAELRMRWEELKSGLGECKDSTRGQIAEYVIKALSSMG